MSFVTAVTVTHNGSRVLEEMLTTLPQEIPLIVVDNASQDNSVEIVERIRPDAKIFKNEIGLGYGNGMNVGLPHVQTEYVLMVNPDTVLNVEAIDAMIAVAEENPQAGLLAPVTYNPDGRIETSHDVVLEKRSLCPSRDGEPVPEGPICADYLSGAVVMGRMSALREIGFFDPEFFLYYEDDDMCRRLKDAGYYSMVVPSAQITHIGGGSIPPTKEYRYEKFWNMAWSRLYFASKYESPNAAKAMAQKWVKKYGAKALAYRLIGQSEKALRDGARRDGAKAYLAGVRASKVPKAE